MILVFGGTTEGKLTYKVLDFVGEQYWYSTKTNIDIEIGGTLIQGGLDEEEMKTFCIDNSIRLIIDAAHPFAVNLHENIFKVATELELTVLRFERKFPKTSSPKIHYFDSYEQLNKALEESNFEEILFLTGVQTIPHFKNIWKKRDAYFRILDTELSRRKAHEFGIPERQIFSVQPNNDASTIIDLTKKTKAKILISKESGSSGFFESKVEAAEKLNLPLWIVKRPELPKSEFTVYSQKELLQRIYLLKRILLKKGTDLESGYTTGTCVLAATKANFIALSEGEFPGDVEVEIPAGDRVKFLVFPEKLTKHVTSCVVIKNAGDDPDVTHAKEIGCELRFSEQEGIRFLQGEGIGRVTLSGLEVPVGGPAINPVPRKTISDLLMQMAFEYEVESGFDVIPFVPEGEDLAKQTFNPRVGVVGGISIIGTTGVVRPFSNEAFLSSIKQQIKVAQKSGCHEIVLTSGKRSEKRVKKRFNHLPQLAFIHFGNLIGETIKLAIEEGIKNINLAIMFGKGIKLAEGHLDTHSKHVQFNPLFAAELAGECGHSNEVVDQIKELKLANAIPDIIPFSEDEDFYQLVAKKSYASCGLLLPVGFSLSLYLLIGNDMLVVS